MSTVPSEIEVPLAPSIEGISTLGRTVRVEGKIVSHQDLHVEGQVDGTIELPDNKLTIGPQARVKATIKAHNVSIVGNAEGTIEANESVELCGQSRLVGDIRTPRLVIKDGAYIKGKVDVIRPAAPKGTKRD
ncbi:MAG TPA: polymer-forming cytoskeletal protein [Bryobacteraceae bacterium]|jgi:cytoskeletal protein CcmA (bactofilin family)|nr:polymer-forming cytoskeletal protein [Bryobacteraceae bacterium]